MKQIFAHEYRITSHKIENLGIREVVVLVVSDKRESATFEVVAQMADFFDQDLNFTHELKLTGYQVDK